MKKYEERIIKLGGCTCRFLNSKGEQVYIKNYSSYSFKKRNKNISISFFLDYGVIQNIAKDGLDSIKVEFDYIERIIEIRKVPRFLYKIFKKAKVLSNKNIKCSFKLKYNYSPKKDEKFSSSINFIYDFKDVYYKNPMKNPDTNKLDIIKLPNILTKKTNEQG